MHSRLPLIPLFVLSLGLLLGLFAAPALAGAPTSFRGVGFGSDISNYPEMQRVPKSGKSGAYYRPEEKLELYGVPVVSVAYYFPEGKLEGVGVVLREEHNHFMIKDQLIAKYGPGTQVGNQYGWSWKDFTIVLRRDGGERFALVFSVEHPVDEFDAPWRQNPLEIEEKPLDYGGWSPGS